MSEWAKLLVPAVALAGIVLFWNIIRPGITKLIFYFLRHEDGQLYFVKYFGDTMGSVNADLSLSTKAVRALEQTVERFERRQNEHERRQDELAATVTSAVNQVNESIREIMVSFARMEGREEQRYNEQHHPGRRRGDDR